MIYYATSHKQGATQLEKKYKLRPVPTSEYISEAVLKRYALFPDHDKLFQAIQAHETTHAYVLNDLVLHFHPDAVLFTVTNSYQEFFRSFV